MLDFFFKVVVTYASKRWRQVGTPCIFHSSWQLNFADRTLSSSQDRTTQVHKEIFTATFQSSFCLLTA